MVRVRGILFLLSVSASLFTFQACSKNGESSGSEDDAATAPLPSSDGSSAACTAAGGTCVSFQDPCPVLQQNTELCGDTVMVCCLPPDAESTHFTPPADASFEAAPPPDSGSSSGADTGTTGSDSGSSSGADSGPEAAPVEASSDGAED